MTGAALTPAEAARLTQEVAAMRAERRSQFEMLAAYERLVGPDSILPPIVAPTDTTTPMLRAFARLLATTEGA